ncbi:MAG: phenylalanine--tRNA ligase subunit alpha, partial [Terriglobales bacterium]
MLSALDSEAAQVSGDEQWKAFRDRWMARKGGILTQVNDQWLKSAPAAAKREVGQRVNELKPRVEQAVELARARLSGGAGVSKLPDRVDITLPGLRRPLGVEHPILQTMNELLTVFRSMGYSIEDGPEIETDYYNFEALNFPPNHPARDTQDTLFVAGQESKPLRERLLLRTHTSPVQIRA